MPVAIIKHKIYMQCHWSFYIVTLNTIQFIRFLKEYKQRRIGTTPLWPRMPSTHPQDNLCMHQWFYVQSARCAAVAHSGRVTLCNYPSPILHANLVSHRWCGLTLHRFMVGFSSRKSVLDMTATAGRQYITLPVRTQWACLNELSQTDRADGLWLGMCHGII